ncbi:MULTISPECIES: SAVED domain-containing protein [unclassified Rhodococcus (in: high G+C Gram-positive bacteria)]|uniref:SAVED domain-containing protein n=1 Tax=unclassified Rhodococcus (in: high G+C Gram-positive bacteria) TaxID=192944 RepID=UPI00163A2A66|nr:MULTISPECIES: SAVED domain-containing protein [unclassified Rhodococcus (in: high G+C Gram-positive bacteria)]MBC2644769.1 SAVED domain-containing protein [Rhodococcus sp. 3A]MBC2898364.1 SAVED domain-containing protein [Rhodococcus sp. 4CII]
MPKTSDPKRSDSAVSPGRIPAVDRKGKRVNVGDLDARRVWVAAGGRCTFCKEFLAEDETTGQSVFTGQLAHIVGATEEKGSPRGKSSKTLEQRALPENLMLLCAGEHKVIDTFEHWSTYGEAQLLAFKQQHERDVRELTGLLRKPKSTVIRVSGDVRGHAVDFSKQAVVRALLGEQRFPDFSLHDDSQNCEVDLRPHDGEDESDGTYWKSTALTLRKRLRPLNNHLKTKEIDHISVFALARIPILVQLGVLLDDVTNVTVHNRRRGSGEGWGWYAEGRSKNLTFGVTEVPGQGDPVVTFSVSGPVDLDALPAELQGKPRYDIRAEGVKLNPKILQSSEDLEALIDKWREVLATLETDHRNQPISLVLAVSAAAAVEIGRAHMTGAHAQLRVFDRINNAYALALETS